MRIACANYYSFPQCRQTQSKTLNESCQRISEDFLGLTALLFQAGAAVSEAVPFVGLAIGKQLQGGADKTKGLVRALLPVLVPLGQFLAGEAVGVIREEHFLPEGYGAFPVLVAFQVKGQLPPRLPGNLRMAGRT